MSPEQRDRERRAAVATAFRIWRSARPEQKRQPVERLRRDAVRIRVSRLM